MDSQVLAAYGIDYSRGMRSCMNNAAFYKKILGMFLRDTAYPRAKTAWESGNREELFARMHELKGITGNAGLTGLYEATLPIVEAVRGSAPLPADLAVRMEAADAAYIRACDGIRLLLTEA